MTDKNSDLPIGYKRGYAKFLNCKIDLSKKVFIPRIETEFWVKKALEELKLMGIRYPSIRYPLILDMFAGSGCIGVAVLKHNKNTFVDFVDIDGKAISQIKINLKLNRIYAKRYSVIQSNLFENIKEKQYDIIFANPPYVARERIKEVQPEVLKYEPKRALFAGKDGLFFIRKFLKEAGNFLRKDGIIYMEIDPQQTEEIKKNLKKYHYSRSSFFRDQFKKYRWLKIKK